MEVLPALREQNVSVFILSKECDTEGMEALLDKMETTSDEPLAPALRSNVTMATPAVYIFTSGTTGALLSDLMMNIMTLSNNCDLTLQCKS